MLMLLAALLVMGGEMVLMVLALASGLARFAENARDMMLMMPRHCWGSAGAMMLMMRAALLKM